MTDDQAIQRCGFRRAQGLHVHLDIGVQNGPIIVPVSSEQIYEPSLVNAGGNGASFIWPYPRERFQGGVMNTKEQRNLPGWGWILVDQEPMSPCLQQVCHVGPPLAITVAGLARRKSRFQWAEAE